jgi:dynein heavy chain
MAYDNRESRLLVYGGWNNGWFDDLYSLTVAKIVGPSYAITHSEPCLGQLSGGVPLNIQGQGFKDANIRVQFTVGNRPVDAVSPKVTIEVAGVFVSETELTCVTPDFSQFGPKEAVMQLSIAGGDLTTTWVPFNYFLNTRAFKSLAYGPGLLQDVLTGTQVEFIIQARNDLCENRTSGNDKFEVIVSRECPAEEGVEGSKPKKVEIPNTIIDRNDGSYVVKYTCEEECST